MDCILNFNYNKNLQDTSENFIKVYKTKTNNVVEGFGRVVHNNTDENNGKVLFLIFNKGLENCPKIKNEKINLVY